MISSFSETGYLIRRSPTRDHSFLQQPEFQRLLGDDFL